ANHVHQLVKRLVGQLERGENLAQFVQGFLGFLVPTAVFGQGLLGSVQLLFQQLEAQPGFFRIWPVVVVVFAGGVVIVVIAAGIAVISRGVFGAGVFTHERLGVVRVEEAGDDVADATFILDDAVVGLNHGAGGAREMCYSGHDIAN